MSASPKALLFICTGNICRSPFAEAWARMRLSASGRDDVLVASAGLQAVEGGAVPVVGQLAASELGVNLSEHRGRQVSEALLRGADRVLVMEPHHADDLAERFELGAPPILSRWAPGPVRPPGIPDPYRGPRWAYLTCYQLIASCVDHLLIDEGLIPRL